MTALPYDVHGREVRAGDTIGFCRWLDSVVPRAVAQHRAVVVGVGPRGGLTYRSRLDGKERRLGRKSVGAFVVGVGG